MEIAEVSYTSIDHLTNTYPLVVVEFWANWCTTCKSFASIYEQTAEKHRDVVFTRAEIGDEQELAERFAVVSVPTLLGFQNGFLMFQRPGAPNPAKLDKLVDTLRNKTVDEFLVKDLKIERKGIRSLGSRFKRTHDS